MMFRSLDNRKNWEELNVSTSIPLYDIAYANGVFIAVGSDGDTVLILL